MKRLSIAIALLLGVATPVLASWDVTARVTVTEPSYMPDQVLFMLDADAGTVYGQTSRSDNNKIIYDTLRSAMLTGTSVEVHGNTHCIAINVHGTDQ